MDIVNGLATNSFYDGLLKYDDLSYRRYKRLDESQREVLKEFNLSPDRLNHVLKLYHYLSSIYNMDGYNIRFAVNALNATYDDFAKRVCVASKKLPNHSDERLLREFKFRGFVTLRKLSRISRNRENSDFYYVYIVCNKRLLDNIYVYPIALSNEDRNLPSINQVYRIVGDGDLLRYSQLLSKPGTKFPLNLGKIHPDYNDNELKLIDKIFAY